MYGAIIGDIVGSKYEFNNIKTKDFPFISRGCSFTDDTIMTVAVAKALLRARNTEGDFRKILVEEMRSLGAVYPHPQGGYGRRFTAWLRSRGQNPYHSYGNGAAMRVSPCGLMAVTLEEALALATASAEVTHNHPEGIKGAQTVAAAVFMAKLHESKNNIRSYITKQFYPLDRTLDEIRENYGFHESCQQSVPEAIIAFLESTDYEDAIRNAISIGGDSDTIGAMTGAIAWSYYRFDCHAVQTDHSDGRIWPDWCGQLIQKYDIDSFLPEDFKAVIQEFDEVRMHRMGSFGRMGYCTPILPECRPIDDY